jgi:hypothetical protein
LWLPKKRTVLSVRNARFQANHSFSHHQTTGKTLEEIDLIFAKPEIRDSALAARMIRDHQAEAAAREKNKIVEYEEKV